MCLRTTRGSHIPWNVRVSGRECQQLAHCEGLRRIIGIAETIDPSGKSVLCLLETEGEGARDGAQPATLGPRRNRPAQRRLQEKLGNPDRGVPLSALTQCSARPAILLAGRNLRAA